MKSTEKSARAPLAVQLEVEFLDRLSEPVRDGKARSVSAIIRAALERFDFTNVVVVHPAQLQISVRVAPEIRRSLRKLARARHTSIGQLVRAAVEAYLPQLEAEAAGQLEMPILAPADGLDEGTSPPVSRTRRKKRQNPKARRRLARKKKSGPMTRKRNG